MDKLLRDELYQQARNWILEAGSTIRNKINDPLDVSTKSNPNDLVTSMDKNTEKYFVEKIKTTYPDHLLLSEEGFGDDIRSLDGIVWIIDPIDGTMNFVQQKRNFAISIGIYHNGIGEIGLIYNVMDDILYHAKRGEGAFRDEVKLAPLKKGQVLEESVIGLNHLWLCQNRLVQEQSMQSLVKTVRGTRTYGSAALEFAYVAEGIVEAYITMSLAPWDIAAGLILVNEVGGITTDIDGNQLNMVDKNPVLTCHPDIHQRIVAEFIQKGRK